MRPELSRNDGGSSVSEIDLTPRDADEPSAERRRLRNWAIVGSLAAVLAFVLFQAITNAAVFYKNADEAVAERTELGDRTFRLQGTVVTEPEMRADGAMVFTVAFGGQDVVVRHVGEEPSDLFELGIPIVAEGHWEDDEFESKQLLVKHSESYVEDNRDRVEYELDES
ncbi:MAG: cytochrome c-type biogenesis protein CcmE [Acidimicrobiales bacterium]